MKILPVNTFNSNKILSNSTKKSLSFKQGINPRFLDSIYEETPRLYAGSLQKDKNFLKSKIESLWDKIGNDFFVRRLYKMLFIEKQNTGFYEYNESIFEDVLKLLENQCLNADTVTKIFSIATENSDRGYDKSVIDWVQENAIRYNSPSNLSKDVYDANGLGEYSINTPFSVKYENLLSLKKLLKDKGINSEFYNIVRAIFKAEGITSKDVEDLINLGVKSQFIKLFSVLQGNASGYNPKVIDLFKDFLAKYSKKREPVELAVIAGKYIGDKADDKELVSQICGYMDNDRLMEYLEVCANPNTKQLDEHQIKIYDKFVEHGISRNVVQEFLWRSYNQQLRVVSGSLKLTEDDIIAKLFELRDYACSKKNMLAPAGRVLSNEEVDKMMFLELNPRILLQALYLVGEKTFKHAMTDRGVGFINFVVTVGRGKDIVANDNMPSRFEPLLIAINPTNSYTYRVAKSKVDEYKKQLRSADVSQRQHLIDKINEYSRVKNSLIRNSVKDPYEAKEIAMLYRSLDNSNADLAIEIEPYLLYSTREEKQKYLNKLNEMVFQVLNIESKDKTVDKWFDFSKSKYIPQLLRADYDSKMNIVNLYDALCAQEGKTVLERLNKLPQNIETKAQFEEAGINYDKWCEFNPDSKIEIVINSKTEGLDEYVIRNLEEEFNNIVFNNIPYEEKQFILDEIRSQGIQVIQVGDGSDFIGFRVREIKDAKKAIHAVWNVFNKREFWSTYSSNPVIENARRSFIDHINIRYKEIKAVMEKPVFSDTVLTIQKADMNNISQALFLGNDSSCCTAVESINGWSAPNYILNKCISAIEIKDGGDSIGNTMCYIAEVDGVVSLVLDNIELKPLYQYNHKILDGIKDYAKKFVEEIGRPEMPIYAGPNRHKLDMLDYKKTLCTQRIIGSTGYDGVYMDFSVGSEFIDGKHWQKAIELYRLV